MIPKGIAVLLLMLFFGGIGSCCAAELLFRKALRNYDREGVVGKALVREFEPRLFTHKTWRQRLFVNGPEGQFDETFEIFTKADNSHWLSYRRAQPSIELAVLIYPLSSQRTQLRKELEKTQITHCEIPLPIEVANRIELLWRTMLPGVVQEPIPETLPAVHGPSYLAFVRKPSRVDTGTIALAAYNSPACEAFIEITDDFRRLCDQPNLGTTSFFRKLSAKVEILTTRLGGRAVSNKSLI